nr:uncharacterized protein LOC109179530 [Ipomoea batatas]
MKSRYARMGKEYMFNTNAQMRTQWKRTGAVVSEGRQVAEAGELIGYSAGRGRGGAKQAIRGGGAADVAETLRNSTVPSIVDEAVNMEVGVDENVSDQRGGRVSSMVAAFNVLKRRRAHDDEHKKRGRCPHLDALLRGFGETLDDCGLHTVHMDGYPFTWERSRGTDAWIEERVDRVLATDDWRSSVPSAKVRMK